MKTSEVLFLVGIVVICALLIIFGPLVVLWALNTLFPILAIPYSFYTWLAVVVLNLTWMNKPKISKEN